MARKSTDTKTRILTTAYGLFYKEGFARVSLDSIAEAVGVTKRTLYYHFDSKDALVAEVLDHQHLHAFARIQAWNTKKAATPAELVTSLFANLERWASTPRWLGSGFTRLTMELADRPGHPARIAARQHKSTVENWLADELKVLGVKDANELASQILLLMEGCLSLILIHGDTRYAASAARAAILLAEDATA